MFDIKDIFLDVSAFFDLLMKEIRTFKNTQNKLINRLKLHKQKPSIEQKEEYIHIHRKKFNQTPFRILRRNRKK